MATTAWIGVPGVGGVKTDVSDWLNRLGRLDQPVVIVKRDEKGLAFDTGLQDAPGSPLLVWHLHCGDHQLWRLDKHAKGYSITSHQTGLVLGADSAMANGTTITMQKWANKPWQLWHIRPDDNEPRTFSIQSTFTEFGPKSMDVWADAAPEAPVQLWDSSAGGQQQKFMLLRPQD